MVQVTNYGNDNLNTIKY